MDVGDKYPDTNFLHIDIGSVHQENNIRLNKTAQLKELQYYHACNPFVGFV